MENLASQIYLQKILDEEKARLDAYKLAWEYYAGRQRDPLKVKSGQPNDNVIVNLYQYIIDKGVAFLFGKDLAWQTQEGEQTQQENYLDEVWRANKKMSFLHGVAVNGGVCGHSFVKIVLDGAEYNGKLYPRLVNLDPAIVRPFWDADDLTKILWYKIEYPVMTPDGIATSKKWLIEPNEERTAWITTRYISRNGGRYEQDGEPELWAYPFPPILDWQSIAAPNQYFGNPDIGDARMQDALNFVASNTQRIIRYHAHPKTIGTGFKAKDVEIDPNEMIVLPSDAAKIANLEMTSDLASSRAFFNDLRGLFLRLSHVPDLDPAVVNVGALSGFALKILYGELIEQTNKKRLTYGEAIVELNRRLQIIGGYQPQETKLLWQSPLPENKSEQVNELKTEIEMGIASKQTASSELGRDWETERARLEEEALMGNSIGSLVLDAFNKGQTPAAG